MRKWVLAAAILVVWSVFLARTTSASDAQVVPPDRVAASLTALGWRPLEAAAAAAAWPARYTLSNDGTFTSEWGRASWSWDGKGWVDLDPSRPYSDLIVEHEYHHLADFQAGRRAEEIPGWWGAVIVADPVLWERIPREHPDDVVHWNHYLAVGLGFRYEKLPAAYRAKWFPYALILDKRLVLPIVLRTAETPRP